MARDRRRHKHESNPERHFTAASSTKACKKEACFTSSESFHEPDDKRRTLIAKAGTLYMHINRKSKSRIVHMFKKQLASNSNVDDEYEETKCSADRAVL